MEDATALAGGDEDARSPEQQVLDAFTDSDMGLGGTNLKGYLLGAQYGLDRNTVLNLRWLSADSIDSFSFIADHKFAVDLFQADVSVKLSIVDTVPPSARIGKEPFGAPSASSGVFASLRSACEFHARFVGIPPRPPNEDRR